MENRTHLFNWIYAMLLIWFMPAGVVSVYATTPDAYHVEPVITSTSEPPLVMIVMGQDHKLYFEAYNDASDLDGDGELDLYYDPTIDYYGYFDSHMTYVYDGTDKRFEPCTKTSSKKVTGTCTKEWSGDYLNYLTMSRMDCLRKVLYGGYRSTDTSTETVLERTYIPKDAHTWGKEYQSVTRDGYDIADYAPLVEPTSGYHLFACTSKCTNSTDSGCEPGDSGYEPVLRVLQNKSSRVWDWVTVAFQNGGIGGSKLGTPTDYAVRVQVGVTGMAEDNCRLYTDSSGNSVYKPIGLLQRYGENQQMYFGLITGSYSNNFSGGVLRRNISDIEKEIDQGTGQFLTTVNGVIQNINKMRLVGLASNGYSGCTWLNSDDEREEGECPMWGNPIGEMMYETLRYFNGKTAATSDFTYSSSDTSLYDNKLDLSMESWVDPYGAGGYAYCSKPFMLVISDVSPNYDSDQLPGSYFNTSFTGDITDLDVEDLGDIIGKAETGNRFIGVAGTDDDGICSQKTIDGFGDIKGLCPEEPSKEGSYYSAAVAYYGRKNDMSSVSGTQSVETFTVGLASPLPKIEITVGTNEITLVPFGKTVYCKNPFTTSPDEGKYQPSNAIVDFYVDSISKTYGKFRINFEDMEEGADFDMDTLVVYEYQVVDATGAAVTDPALGSKVKITVTATEAAASPVQHSGYIISGTSADGTYLVVRDVGTGTDVDYYLDTPAGGNWKDGVSLPTTDTRTFSPDTSGSAATLLETPLWYAGKWGGFEDQNSDDTPDLQDEWDEDKDSVPDNYLYVTNATKLETQLNTAFDKISVSSASGTSSSVLATTNDGDGTLFQAYFKPSIESLDLTWVGYLNALWMDSEGNIREESGDNPYQLNPSEDDVITFFLDEGENKTKARRYEVSASTMYPDTETASYSEIELEDILPIWEAGSILAKTAASARKIYTSAGTDLGIEFSATNIDKFKYYLGVSDTDVSTYSVANLGLLGSDLDTRAGNLVSYIRGTDITGLRNRTSDSKVWKLGDIIYSTPVSVAGAVESYHKVYSDQSYGSYVSAQSGRMTVVYAGANDGMLHAFAGGYYNKGTKEFKTGTGVSTIGQELWAYIPRAVLPHLKWLADPGYTHSCYVDLMPKVFDAKLNGSWGTYLLLGLNMGGKDINVDIDGDGTIETGETVVPTYTLIDITDPTAPVIKWENSYDEMGMSRSVPTIIKVGGRHWVEGTGWADDNDPHWLAVFGSGPHGDYAYKGKSDQKGHVYVIDLTTGESFVSGGTSYKFTTTQNGVINWPENLDQGLTYEVDSVYFAESISDSSGNETGKVWSFDTYDQIDSHFTNKEAPINWPVSHDPTSWHLHLLLDQFPTTNAYSASGSLPPITAPLNLGTDNDGNIWLYLGTGKYISDSDKSTTAAQYLFGLKDPFFSKARNYVSGTSAAAFDLNSTGGLLESNFYWVYTDTSVRKCDDYATCTSYTDVSGGFDTLLNIVRWDGASDTKWLDGWFRELEKNGTDPSERCISESAVLGGGVFVAGFTPISSVCSLGGTSNLYGLYYETGTAYFNPLVGSSNSTTGLVDSSVEIGKGTPPATTGFTPNGEEIITQLSTGEVVETEADTALEYKSRITNWFD